MACSGIFTNNRCGTPTIKIESFYPFQDCHQNTYKNGYSNAIRLNGVLYFDKQSEKVDTNDFDIITMRQIYEVYKLELHKIQADSWALRHLLQVVLAGNNITIAYTNEFGVEKIDNGFFFKGEEVQRTPASLSDWYIKIDLWRKVCKVNLAC